MQSQSVERSGREVNEQEIAEQAGLRMIAWFAKQARPLPWRSTYTPYQVWISEVMLQQTQMERGVAYYRRWMQLFPDIFRLAEASEQEVLKAWEGLGYYSRARNLIRTARLIVERFQGVFPRTAEELKVLPGIGPYTASAIASIAFGQMVACVDANVERVVSRLFDLAWDVKSREGKDRVAKLARALIPQGQARAANQACMELGALICTKNPQCGLCPLTGLCRAQRAGTEQLRPVKAQPKKRQTRRVVAVLLVSQDRLLVQKREKTGLWGGLFVLPFAELAEGADPVRHAEEVISAQLQRRPCFLHWQTQLTHAHTSWQTELHACAFSLRKGSGLPLPVQKTASFSWVRGDELSRLPFPAPHRRLLERYFAENAK